MVFKKFIKLYGGPKKNRNNIPNVQQANVCKIIFEKLWGTIILRLERNCEKNF